MTTCDPRVGIVMRCHNGGDFVSEAVASIRAQTYRAWTLALVDDASTDDALHAIQALNDPRIHLIRHHQARGSMGALRSGISALHTPLLAICDHDDRWQPDKLQRQIAVLDADFHVGVVATRIREINPNGHVQRGKFDAWFNVPVTTTDPASWIGTNRICFSSVLMRRGLPLPPHQFAYAGDFFWWLTAFWQGWGIVILPEALTDYRSHPNQMSSHARVAQEYWELAELAGILLHPQLAGIGRDDLIAKSVAGFAQHRLCAHFSAPEHERLVQLLAGDRPAFTPLFAAMVRLAHRPAMPPTLRQRLRTMIRATISSVRIRGLPALRPRRHPS